MGNAWSGINEAGRRQPQVIQDLIRSHESRHGILQALRTGIASLFLGTYPSLAATELDHDAEDLRRIDALLADEPDPTEEEAQQLRAHEAGDEIAQVAAQITALVDGARDPDKTVSDLRGPVDGRGGVSEIAALDLERYRGTAQQAQSIDFKRLASDAQDALADAEAVRVVGEDRVRQTMEALEKVRRCYANIVDKYCCGNQGIVEYLFTSPKDMGTRAAWWPKGKPRPSSLHLPNGWSEARRK